MRNRRPKIGDKVRIVISLSEWQGCEGKITADKNSNRDNQEFQVTCDDGRKSPWFRVPDLTVI
jgi:hypothetical protein